MAAHKPNLNVMTWNVDSISPKKHEVFDFLLRNDIDTALINETYLKLGTRFSTLTSDAIGLTEKEHEPKVELPYWCGKIYPTAY
jgi:hypothetical protein